MRSKCLRSVWAVLVIAGITGIVGWLVSCDNDFNPFSPNLGKKVDIEYPVTYIEEPKPGRFLRETVTFSGRATAYRELSRVEFTILGNDSKESTLRPWTAVSLSGADKKEKKWTYNLDTTGLSDGLLKIKFRAIDSAGLVEASSVKYIYVIKNGPSEISMSNPEEESLYKFSEGDDPVKIGINENSVDMYTDTRILGTIIDRRGIKPGFPQIKIWPKGPEPTSDRTDPAYNPNLDWAVLFLSDPNVDKELSDDLVNWRYGPDIGGLTAKNSVDFAFRLSPYTLEFDDRDPEKDPLKQRKIIVYERDSNDKVVANSFFGEYYFKIRTSDTFILEDQSGAVGAMKIGYPRPPVGDEIEKMAYEPEQGKYDVDYHYINVIPTTSEVTRIRLDNSDTQKSNAQLRESEPNIYMYDVSSNKIIVGQHDRLPDFDERADFRLRINAYHSTTVQSAVLQWYHPAKGAGFLPWDDEGLGYVDATSDTTKAEKGHKGAPPATGDGRIFTFTGLNNKSFEYYPSWDGDPDHPKGSTSTGVVFTSDPQEYTLTVTARIGGDIAPEKGAGIEEYFLTLDDGSPDVEITDIRGRSANRPDDPGAKNAGGYINTNQYTVNDNIEVTADILKTDWSIKENSSGAPLIKWFLEEGKGTDPDGNDHITRTDILLSDIKNFRGNPTTDSFLTYFNGVALGKARARGWVSQKKFTVSVDTRTIVGGVKNGTNTLDHKYLWLYVVAQDKLGNLGYVVQKLYVDNDGDTPTLTLPTGLYDTLNGIASRDELIAANKIGTNALDDTSSISLTFSDDDGMLPSGIQISLYSLNLNRTANISGSSLTGIGSTPLKEMEARDGTLTQATMAAALNLAPRTTLPDGVYTLTITATDNTAVKIQPTVAVSNTKTIHFVVRTQPPAITLDSALEALFKDKLLPPGNVEIKGTVVSRLQIQRLEITFSPDIITPDGLASKTVALNLYSDAACTQLLSQSASGGWAATPAPVNGDYVYYWKYPTQVNFDPAFPAGSQPLSGSRTFELKAWDRMGETSGESRTGAPDSKAPQVESYLFNFDRKDNSNPPKYVVNGKVPIEITASDENGLGTRAAPNADQPMLRWFVLPTTASFPAGFNYWAENNDAQITALGGRTGWFTNADNQGGARYRTVLYTPTMTERDYRVYVIARDKAGNENKGSGAPDPLALATGVTQFTISQSSDVPTLQRIAPLNGDYLGGVNSKLEIKGAIYDDDGFNTARAAAPASRDPYVRIRFRKEGATTWSGSTWYPITGTAPAATFVNINTVTGELEFTFDFTDPATAPAELTNAARTALVDGEYQYQLWILDEEQRGTGPDSRGRYTPEGKNPDWPEGATTGSNPLAFQNITLPSSSGSYSFTLKNSSPQIFFSHYDPTEGHPNYSATRPTFNAQAQLLAALGGTISDIRLANAWFTYGNSTTRNPLLSGNPTGETHTWTVTNSWLNAFATASEGMYSVNVLASDILGNSTPVEWTFYKDSSGPAISFTNISATTLMTVSGDAGDVFITGLFTDKYSDIGTTFDYRFDSGAWNTSTASPSNTQQKTTLEITGNVAAWTVSIDRLGVYDNASFPDGKHTFSVRARDTLGNQFETLDVPFVVDRKPPQMITRADDGASVANRIIVKGVTGVPADGWLAPNERVFSATSAKAAGAATNTTVVFTLSGLVYEHNLNRLSAAIRNGTTAPTTGSERARTLTGIYDSPIAWNKGGTVLTSFGNGTGAPNNLTGATFRVRRAASGDFGLNGTAVATYENRYVWELDVRVKDMNELITVAGMGGDDILRTITVTARDLAPSDSETETWAFYLDSTAPIVTFSNLAASPPSILEDQSAITLKGEARDDTNIQKIEYQIDTYSYSGGTWTNGTYKIYYTDTGASSSNRVNFDISDTQLNSEGRYRVTIRASDWSLGGNGTGTRGNEGTYGPVEFYIDRSDPVITWPATQAFYRWDANSATGKIVFNLSVTDANTIGSPLTGELRKFPVTTPPVLAGTVTVAAATPDQTTSAVTVTITRGAVAPPDGKYVLALTIRDKAGRTASFNQTLTFDLDNTAPTITLDPSNANAAITGRVEFKGSFDKSASLSRVARVAYAVSASGAAPSTVTARSFTTTANALSADLQNNTRRYTFAGHNLAVGDTVTVNNTNRYVLWVNGDNFKLSNNYTMTTPATNVWNPAAGDIEVHLSRDAVLRGAGWLFNDGANYAGKLTHSTGGDLAQIDQGLAKATLLLYDTRRFNNTGLIGTMQTAAGATPTFNGLPISGMEDKEIYPVTIHLLAIDEAGNLSTLTRAYWIYPAGDYPIMKNITTPNDADSEENRQLNGTIKIAGVAEDNYRVRQVWFRVLKDGYTGTAYNSDGSIPSGYEPALDMKIPNWTTSWGEAAGNQTSRSQTFKYKNAAGVTQPATTGVGWFVANRTSESADTPVSWWAQINKDGELDPKYPATSRKIIIQTLAEDTIWNDSLNGNNGGYSETGNWLSVMKEVSAVVVSGAPTFVDEQARSAASNAATDGFNGWESMLTAAVKKRAAYQVTVRHTSGVSAIRWTNNPGSNTITPAPSITPTLNVTSTTNLLDITDAAWTAQIAQVDSTTANTAGVAIKARPKNSITNSTSPYTVSLPAGTYMILKPFASENVPSAVPAGGNQQYTTFTTAATTVNLSGGAELLPKTDGFYEWLVTVDINTEKLGFASKAGYHSLNFEAYEISKSSPLFSRKTAAIPIDNLPPTGVYTLSTKIVGQSSFGGEARDQQADVSGLSRVVLWFSRVVGTTETSVAWNEKASPAGTFVGQATDPADIDFTGKPSTVKVPVMPAEGAAAQYSCIVIDRNDKLGGQNHHGHQLGMGWVAGGIGQEWYVSLNSLLIESGKVTAHFIVYDRAGNATYYKQNLMILNGVPRITSITLATDIGVNNTLQTALGSGSGNVKFTTDGSTPTNGAMAIIRNTMGNAVTTDAARGISEAITIETDSPNRIYSAVFDREDFIARNSLLAVKVDTTVPQTSTAKQRNYRVEYVSGAVLKETTATLVGSGGIRAGRMYIINETGTGFPWGVLGAQGETFRRGLVFLALQDGADLDPQVKTGSYGTPSAWELNSAYYTGTDLTRNVPTNLRFGTTNTTGHDITYPGAGSGTTPSNTARTAEFVYGQGAFGSTAGSSIVDFDAGTNGANLDAVTGRPKPYPAVATAAAQPWREHSLFIIRIFDGVETDLFGDFALLSIRVNNDDKTPPYAQLYDLNPKMEGEDANYASGDIARETALNAGTKAQIGGNTNRIKGGLWNATGKSTDIEKSGHIEPRTGTSLTSAQMGGATGNGTITRPGATSGAYFTVDTVSGDIIVRGYAEDNQRVARVDLEFCSTAATPVIWGAPVTILTQAAKSARAPLAVPAALADPEHPEQDRVKFTETIDLNVHRVEWAYVWKSEELPFNGPTGNTPLMAGNITLRVKAYNANGTPRGVLDNVAVTANANVHTNKTIARSAIVTPGTAGSLTARNAFDSFNVGFPEGAAANNFFRYNQIQVNLRPYITGFLRDQDSSSTNIRSRQGRYIFARGETPVITGFNLRPTATGGATTLTINGANLTTGELTSAQKSNYVDKAKEVSDAHQDLAYDNILIRNRYRMVTGSTAALTTGEGLITLTVNTQPAANTGSERRKASGNDYRPLAIQPWNKEYSAGVEGSELWDDFTMAHIWRSDANVTADYDRGRFSRGRFNISYPSMSINPNDGTLWESHQEGGNWPAGVAYSGGGSYFSSNNNNETTNTGNVANTGGNGRLTQVASWSEHMTHTNIFVSGAANGSENFTLWNASSSITMQHAGDRWTTVGGMWLWGPTGAAANTAAAIAANPPHLINTALPGDSLIANGPRTTAATNVGAGGETTLPPNPSGFEFPKSPSQTGHYAIESLWYNGATNSRSVAAPVSLEQFHNPNIVSNGTGTGERVHISYYDEKDGSLKYRWNQRGSTGIVHNQASPRRWVNLDGGADVDDNAPITGRPGSNAATDTRNYGQSNSGVQLRYTTEPAYDPTTGDAGTSGGTTANWAYTGGTSYTITSGAAVQGTTWATPSNNNTYVHEVHVRNGSYVTAGTLIYSLGEVAQTSGTDIQVIAATAGFIVLNSPAPVPSGTAGNWSANNGGRIGATGAIYRIYAVDDTRIRGGAARLNSKINAGKYNSIDVTAGTNGGWPVIAYYDETNQGLKLAVSNNGDPTSAANWKVFGTSEIFTGNNSSYAVGTGEYVSLKINQANINAPKTFHIAAMNAISKNVVYITGTLNTTTNLANYTLSNVTVQIVDSALGTGGWCRLSLDASGSPWIAYMDKFKEGSREGVKIAYKNTARFYKGDSSHFSGQDMDAYGASITGWEAMHVPTQFKVEDAQLGMERYPTIRVPNPGTNNGRPTGALPSFAAVGFLGEDYYRIAYYIE